MKPSKLQTLPCPRCGLPFNQNAAHQAHCVKCAYVISIEKSSARRAAKRAKG